MPTPSGSTAPGRYFRHSSGNTSCRGAGFGAFRRQFNVQLVRHLQGNGALDCVFQLADIARPFVIAESVERIFVDAQNAAVRGGRVFLQKVIGQQRDVFAALAQVRHADGNHVEAVIEIFAEKIFGDGFVEIAIGGGDDAHIDGNFAGAADRAHGALLQDAQQLHLHGQSHFADFVEEDGSAAGHFKQSALVLIGSGEGSLQIAEQFAFQQSFGKAPQFTETKGSVARGEQMWTARATSSLPVPLSP